MTEPFTLTDSDLSTLRLDWYDRTLPDVKTGRRAAADAVAIARVHGGEPRTTPVGGDWLAFRTCNGHSHCAVLRSHLHDEDLWLGCFIKLSIGFFLLRLADRTKWRPFLIGTLIFIGCFTIGSTFAIIFQCNPVAAGWDYSLRPPAGDAKCYDAIIFKNVGVFNSSVNIATDLLFALIPIPMVWKLQVNLRTRIGLAVVLSLGLFASAIAIYKTPMQANFFKETDWSGHGSWYYIWQQVEMNVGIIAANLPTLKPLFANFFGHMRTFTKGRSTASRSGPGLSGPFRSNGYHKHDDWHTGTGDQSSYAMRDISTATESKKKDSYDEILALGKEAYGDVIGSNMRQSTMRASNESTPMHQGPRTKISPMSPTSPMSPRSAELGRFTITKTTEVRNRELTRRCF
ncbi:hypothetical protein OPT61_g632 [Boeremia exigua]|uniref:Uncharacterized protein n=1 Tax=Boeremia exigua TaxID=749465 RepID=A0ACC2IT68_9PLEO|nr:hypothetical protein OPT61_g632 [Boeremia exigua]